jgi:hypothetical protein
MGCGNRNLAFFYFLFFHLIVSVIILNLVIAIALSATLEHLNLKKLAVDKF